MKGDVTMPLGSTLRESRATGPGRVRVGGPLRGVLSPTWSPKGHGVQRGAADLGPASFPAVEVW